jgi:hypothetical protein
MSADTDFERPYFFEALKEWTQLLSEHGLPSKILWVLDENLVFETDPSRPNGVRLSYQTRFTATPPELAERTYAFFSDVEARMVFYCLGTSNGQSVCMILCDPVFESRGAEDGFIRRDDWLISFHPGPGTEIEEITDEQRWRDRVLRGRPLSDLDFCMPLDVLRELDAHGRPLSEYERFGMKVLGAYQRWSKSGR